MRLSIPPFFAWKRPLTIGCQALLALNLHAQFITPLPDKVKPVIPDLQDSQVPDRVHLAGWLGTRIHANEANRLVKMDLDRLLEGYRKRPGRQAWDGEHVGKWLHAATLAWANSGDPGLRKKLDHVVAELCKCQLPDGYLGTYLDKNRWTEWDVWAHKYNLIGLLTYIRYTGNEAPMATCRRMADLLCNTFGDEPGKRDIIKAGYHAGLAPTSVLLPMVLLYRMTGEPRYLDFCKYILRAWEQPDGPKVVSTLLTAKRVDKVGNGKAYEMLSCLDGLLEYYRTVGDPKALQACLNAWEDIVAKRLYITGTASYGEFFHGDYDLPNVSNVGETCVTVTWLQFNAQLLRLTDQARFADQLERVALNQLLGAQQCDGTAWGYYVQMEGVKPYRSTLDGNCCLSSGPRGIALLPTFAITTDADGVVVNLFEAGHANLSLRDGRSVIVRTQTRFPEDGVVRFTLEPANRKTFAFKMRAPSWCPAYSLRVNGRSTEIKPDRAGYLVLKRRWHRGDQVELKLELEPRVIAGKHTNQGKVAIMFGPLVLAADEALLPPSIEASKDRGTNAPLNVVALPGMGLDRLHLVTQPAPVSLETWPGAEVFRVNAVTRQAVGALKPGSAVRIGLRPFADAGEKGTEYKVWLPLSEESKG